MKKTNNIVMPTPSLTNFLKRVNKARGDLPELTESGFKELLRNRHTEELEHWLPIFKKTAKCIKNDAGTNCYSEQKKGTLFDDTNCTLKLQSVQPFAKCLHRSQETGIVELADRSLLVNFLKLYRIAATTLLRAWGREDMLWSWTLLFDHQVTADALEYNAMSLARRLRQSQVFELTAWISDALMYDHKNSNEQRGKLARIFRLRLAKFLGGGQYGSVFLASTTRKQLVAVKIVTVNQDDLFPPRFEVELAKAFPKEGVGFEPLTEIHGFIPTRVSEDNVAELLVGPDFGKEPPKALHSALGWYAMEQFDMTLHSFLDERHGANPASMHTVAISLAKLLNTARGKQLVHADLHIGVKKVGAPEKKSLRRRMKGKQGTEEDDKQTQAAVIKFCDCSRSYTLAIAHKARTALSIDLRLTPDAACLIGSCNDICTLLQFIVDLAMHTADNKFKRAMPAVLVGHIIEKTELAKHLGDAAASARGGLRTAIQSVHAMLESEDWKEILKAKDLNEAVWHDRKTIIGELYAEAYAIPACIYKPGSPALRGVSRVSLEVTS